MLNFCLILYSLLILCTVIVVKCHFNFDTNEFVTPSHQTVIRHVREITGGIDSDYSWKATKTPSFVTSQMKKQQEEPSLTVFPSEGTFRNGRSREILPSGHNSVRNRIYYSTLPDISHHSTRPLYNPYSEFIRLPVVPLRSNQRSYDVNKVGQDFVTRVQSAIINVAGEDKNQDKQKSGPSFTIVDSPPNQYPMNSINRIMQPVAYHNKHMTGIEYHQSPYYGHPRPHLSNFKLPYSSSLPYYNAGNHVGLSQHHYEQQSSPYYDEVEKIHAPEHEHQHNQPYVQQFTDTTPYHSPYPSRHIRFPADRYPLKSPFSDLLSSSRPNTPPMNSHLLDSSFPQHSSNLGFGDGISTNPSAFDFNDNLGPVTMDHNLDFDNKFINKPLTVRNKFLNFDKYLDTSNNLNSDFPFYNSQFSPASDTLTKPFDLDEFSLAAAAINNGVTNEKDFHVKGSTQNQNGDTVNTTMAAVASSATSLSDVNTEATQDNIGIDYGADLDAS